MVKPKFRQILLYSILFILAGCGQQAKPEGGSSQAPPAAGAAKELGLACLDRGDLACAEKNYCAIQGQPSASVRCCLTLFLEAYFSENTGELGRMLGYAPLSFEEVRKMSRQEILERKSLPFAELILLSHDEAPAIGDLARRWGTQLVQDRASTSELMERVGRLGTELEPALSCLDLSLGSFRTDSLEAEIFHSDSAVETSARDLFFLRFFLGVVAYGTQAASYYDLGAEQFPAWPPDDLFLADVNGLAGEGDARFGELQAGEADRIAKLFPQLLQAFEALKQFSALKGSPAKIDAYLNWRLSEDFQARASRYLKAAYASLQNRDWVPIPESDFEIRLRGLGGVESIPDSETLPKEIPFLQKDSASGEVRLNHDFLAKWFSPLVRELTK